MENGKIEKCQRQSCIYFSLLTKYRKKIVATHRAKVLRWKFEAKCLIHRMACIYWGFGGGFSRERWKIANEFSWKFHHIIIRTRLSFSHFIFRAISVCWMFTRHTNGSGLWKAWDEELARIARRWALQCNPLRKDHCRDVGKFITSFIQAIKIKKLLKYEFPSWISRNLSFYYYYYCSFESYRSTYFRKLSFSYFSCIRAYLSIARRRVKRRDETDDESGSLCGFRSKLNYNLITRNQG